MKNLLASGVAGLLALTAVAEPGFVDGKVIAKRNLQAQTIEISYELLGGPAYVTLDAITTNGIAVAAEDFRDGIRGAINCKVTDGVKRAVWIPNSETWAACDLAGVEVDVNLSVWQESAPPDFMVADLVVTDRLKTLAFYSSTNVLPGGVGSELYRTSKLLMRRIPAKDVVWRMGSNATEPNRDKLPNTDRSPIEIPHYVKLTSDYYMAVFPMTIGQRQLAMTGVTSTFRAPSYLETVPDAVFLPDNNLSFDALRGKVSDGIDWPVSMPLHGVKAGCVIDLLRTRTGLPGLDLPTEAQWEFACRAGVGTGLYSGREVTSWDGACTNVNQLGWTYANTTNGYATKTATAQYRMPMPVGRLQPNEWGLYDMYGNALEWCLDWYAEGEDYFATFGDGYKTGDVVVDPLGPRSTVQSTVSKRVIRSAGPGNAANSSRSANRRNDTPANYSASIGYRLVCPLVGL